jgi:Flp pilus assembly pilin Flp
LRCLNLSGEEQHLPLPFYRFVLLVSPSDVRLQYGAVDMFHLKQRMKWLEGAAGQGLVEYAVILLFVAVAVVGAVVSFGGALNNYYLDIIDRLPFR